MVKSSPNTSNRHNLKLLKHMGALFEITAFWLRLKRNPKEHHRFGGPQTRHSHLGPGRPCWRYCSKGSAARPRRETGHGRDCLEACSPSTLAGRHPHCCRAPGRQPNPGDVCYGSKGGGPTFVPKLQATGIAQLIPVTPPCRSLPPRSRLAASHSAARAVNPAWSFSATAMRLAKEHITGCRCSGATERASKLKDSTSRRRRDRNGLKTWQWKLGSRKPSTNKSPVQGGHMLTC